MIETLQNRQDSTSVNINYIYHSYYLPEIKKKYFFLCNIIIKTDILSILTMNFWEGYEYN